MKKLTIYHDTVNFKIMQYLKEKVSFNSFHTDMQKGEHEYYVDMEIDGYKFEVCVTVEDPKVYTMKIFKDREYVGHRRGNPYEFNIARRDKPGTKSLQEMFEETFLKDYLKYLED